MNGGWRERHAILIAFISLTIFLVGCAAEPEAAATVQAVVEQIVASPTATPSPSPPPTSLPTRSPPTSTPIPVTQPPPTATPVPPTPSPTPNIFVNISDQLDDVVNCQTQAAAVDSEVDLKTVQAWADDELLWVRILMATPLIEDYSFAVLLGIESGENATAYIWEIHDQQFRIGKFDPQVGDLTLDTTPNLNIQHDTGSGELHYSMTLSDTVQSGVNTLQVASFHSSAAGEPTICDSLGPLTFTVPP